MRKLGGIIFGLLLFATLPGFTEAASTNLIINPGNESALVAGEIPGWTEVVGSNWARRGADPLPFEGTAYFFPGVAAVAELAQLVDVSAWAPTIDAGQQEFDFEGYVRAFVQAPPDTSRIVLEYRNAGGGVLTSFDSGNIASVNAWQLVSDSRTAPVGTRGVRVRLISTRNGGSNNDGYYDGLSLTAQEFEVVPEPSTLTLLAFGGMGLLRYASQRRKRA